MRFIEKIQVSLAPQNYRVAHFCGEDLAAVASVKATETICRIYEQKLSDLSLRGEEQRPARLAIKNYLLAFPVFNTLDVCRSCVRGPVVRPTSKLMRVK